MVNPIIASIIKKAIKGSMNTQKGGDSGDSGSGKTKSSGNIDPRLFLVIMLVIIIIEFVVCDIIARDKLPDILGKKDEASPSTASPSTAAPSTASPSTAAPSTAAPSTAAPSTAAPSTAAPSTAAPDGDTFINTSRNLTAEELDKWKNQINKEIYLPLLFINILIISGLYIVPGVGYGSDEASKNSVKKLFTISFCVMISSIIISYMVKVSKSKKVIYFSEYIGVAGYTTKQVTIGMMTNIIFGFIDNFGLFFGMDSLDEWLNEDSNNERDRDVKDVLEQKGGREMFDDVDCLYNNPLEFNTLTTAGWGNTFSDFLGAFIGNAVGDIATTLSGVEKTPIISEILGIVIGCILGIYVPARMKQEGMIPGLVNSIASPVTTLLKKSGIKKESNLMKPNEHSEDDKKCNNKRDVLRKARS